MSEPADDTRAQAGHERAGYLHRRAPLTEVGLRALIAHVFGDQTIHAFGANSADLQQIRPYPSTAELRFGGEQGPFDSGHVFSLRAEVRWKYDGAAYDALVLTEDETLLAELGGSQPPLGNSFTARQADRKIELLLNTPGDIQKRGMRWRLGYWEYRGSNQAVQFMRYTELREELDR